MDFLSVFFCKFAIFLIVQEFIQHMEWTQVHDVYMCREILSGGLLKTKKKTVQRAQMWDKIAVNLCSCETLKFSVTKRAVRDRYALIAAKYRKKMNAEEKVKELIITLCHSGTCISYK